MLISLGSNCCIAWQLKKHNHRSESFPFDWSKITLHQLICVLENDFKNYSKLQIKKFSENHLHLDNNSGSYILYNAYNITFAHELLCKDNIDILETKIENRITKFKELINPTFIRIETNVIKNTNNYNILMELLKKYFTNFKLIIISTIKPNILYDNFIHYKINDFNADWKYDNLDWKQIFNFFQ